MLMHGCLILPHFIVYEQSVSPRHSYSLTHFLICQNVIFRASLAANWTSRELHLLIRFTLVKLLFAHKKRSFDQTLLLVVKYLPSNHYLFKSCVILSTS